MGIETSARATGKADANRKIIGAARHLFTKRGFHQAAMSDLARQAGISVGQIYRSFSSKNEIILKLVEDEIRSCEDEVRDLSRREGFKHLSTADQLTSSLLGCVADDREAISNEIMAEAYRNPQVANAIRRFCVFLQRHLESLILSARPGVMQGELACTRFLILYVFALRQKSMVAPRVTRQAVRMQIHHVVEEMLDDLAGE
jgi:TetR/AcrR family transcriptional repressor of uid operon